MTPHLRRFGLSLLLLAGTSFAVGTLHPDSVPSAHAQKIKDSKILPIGKSPSKGPKNALVTIVEFSDFQCPYCAKVNPTLEKIRANHPDVRIVFKNNPLPFHQQAEPAARAALAAGKQGKFWQMHDLLFENQKQMRQGNVDSLFEGYAKSLGLNMKRYRKDYSSAKLSKSIKADQALSAKVGARGTPSFFINGIKFVGAQPYQKFEDLINKERAAAKAAKVKRNKLYAARVKANFTAPKPRNAPSGGTVGSAPTPPPDMIHNVAVDTRDAMRGNTKVPLVTIVEFSDYQCPFCARAEGTIEQVMKTHGDNVRLVYKHMPLAFHKEAEPAARAAIAAGRQGKYWEYHAELYQRQREMRGNTEFFIDVANKVGLDLKRFEKDMNDPAAAQQVKDDMAQASKIGVRGTPNFFINGVKLTGAQPYAKFDEIIQAQLKVARKVRSRNKRLKGEALYQKIIEANRKGKGKAMAQYEKDLAAWKTAQKKAEEEKARKAQEEAANIKKYLKVGSAPVKGSLKAPVIIYEFTDLQCPFCSRANTTINQLVQANPGKIALVSKQFPLAFHKEAEPAARAALAAGKQGKFWQMRDKLFARQREMRSNTELFIQLADELGLDLNRFEKDMKDPALAKQVKDDMVMGGKVGVRGTPHFFINGVRLSGAQPLNKFQEAVDAALKANKKP